MSRKRGGLLSLVVAICMILSTGAAVFAQSAGDSNLRAQIMNKALNKSEFKNIQVDVNDGAVKLAGTVDVFDAKRQADERVHRVKGVVSVDNEIQVAGPTIPDSELRDKVLKAVEYDRVGYRVTPFNAISVNVEDGVVTLGGHAYGPVDADSAVATVANMKGVKDVVNDIQVDPVSPFDDRIRVAVYRAVYGFPSLNKYAIDPAQPIRISVQNGHVTLYGVVDSQSDKEAAGIRANSVGGVFSVANDLQVAGQVPEK
jgi:hyperosmotically inducible periplasmic protein